MERADTVIERVSALPERLPAIYHRLSLELNNDQNHCRHSAGISVCCPIGVCLCSAFRCAEPTNGLNALVPLKRSPVRYCGRLAWTLWLVGHLDQLSEGCRCRIAAAWGGFASGGGSVRVRYFGLRSGSGNFLLLACSCRACYSQRLWC